MLPSVEYWNNIDQGRKKIFTTEPRSHGGQRTQWAVDGPTGSGTIDKPDRLRINIKNLPLPFPLPLPMQSAVVTVVAANIVAWHMDIN